MLNKNEQRKQIRKSIHDDMVVRVNPVAEAYFRREPYPVSHQNVKAMLEIKKSLNFIISRAGLMDSWEQETIRRIEQRIREGSDTDG